MKLVTRHSLAALAAARWKKQYPRNTRSQFRADKKWSNEIYAELVGLGDHPDPDDVDRVIGNNSWTLPGMCWECRENKPQLVQLLNVVEDVEFELCGDCLIKALNLFEENC